MYCECISLFILEYILPFFFHQDVQKENESFKAQIQELKQENCKQVQLPIAVLLTEVRSGWWQLAWMAWKTRSCTAHGNPRQLQFWVALRQLFWLLHISSCFFLSYGFAALCSFLRLLCPWPEEAGQDSLKGPECSFLGLQQCLVNKADPGLCCCSAPNTSLVSLQASLAVQSEELLQV